MPTGCSGDTLDQPGCNPAPAAVPASPHVPAATVAVPHGPGRFLNGIFGRDGDWLLVPAAVALTGILVTRRREPRTDPLRGAAVLWAAWLFLTWCFFASSHSVNSYYLAAFAPAIAALCGMGLALAWRLRERPGVHAVVGGTVVAATAYGLYLLPSDAGVRPWIVASTLVLALATVAVATVSLWPGRPSWTVRAAVGLSAAAFCAGTVWASATVVAAGLGPFDSPYQSAALTAADHAANARSAANTAGLTRAAANVAPTVSVITAETSAQSSVPILATGHEFLPVGGFTGRVPSTTLAQFVADVPRGGSWWCWLPSRRGPGTPTCSGPWRTAGPWAAPGPRRRARRCASLPAHPRTPARRRGAPESHATRRRPRGVRAERADRPADQTSRKRRMAMAEPTEPIAMPTMTTTTLVSKTSDPVMCIAVKMLLVVRPLPS